MRFHAGDVASNSITSVCYKISDKARSIIIGGMVFIAGTWNSTSAIYRAFDIYDSYGTHI